MNKKMDEETIQILSVSDDNANSSKPEWWQRNGTCHIINSYMGNLEIVAKAKTEGNVRIDISGPNIVDPEDNSKHVPYWVDFTKFTINEKTIFDTLTPTWFDKPYRYNMDVKANEEIKIYVEWQPHKSDT
ncbi:MAG: hypothetical protein IJQ01_10025 [Selenomonadaceae bacterium]|nr:hypothetical protein [Selenomonadaceae bacterium]